jgi:DNA-directed RNA polymerase subunit RPC12/RpoP
MVSKEEWDNPTRYKCKRCGKEQANLWLENGYCFDCRREINIEIFNGIRPTTDLQ